MKNATRELLLITKAARHWDTNFNEQVEALMHVVGEVDTEEHVAQATEVMDVYHHSLTTTTGSGKRRNSKSVMSRPFAFTAFRN